jgi:hypothetical protein
VEPREPNAKDLNDGSGATDAAVVQTPLEPARDRVITPQPPEAELAESGEPMSEAQSVDQQPAPGKHGGEDAEVADKTTPATPLITALEEALQMRVIVYFGVGSMSPSDATPLHKLLEAMGAQTRAALVVQSPGGDPDAAHFLASILHEYILELHVHIPTYAASAATLLALNADKLWMGPVSELSPIDPQVPIDPRIVIPSLDPSATLPADGDRLFIPAHVIRDFLELAGVTGTRSRRQQVDTERLRLLIEPPLNPWILGMYERFDKVSRVYAREALTTYLLKDDPDREQKTERIVETLCDYYASHDAYILRGPARRMGLPVRDCAPKAWEIMRSLVEIYDTLPAQVIRVIETLDGFETRTTARRTCPMCSEISEVRDGHIFCPACGQPFQAQCDKCSEPRQEGWKHCPRCGSTLSEQV